MAGGVAIGRRAALLEAAIELIGRHGLAAVTHRSVAAAAGVPAATTGYYFASKAQLVDEALRTLAERDLADLRERQALLGAPRVEAVADALAAWLVERATAADGTALLAQHQLQIEAVRRPELRPPAAVQDQIHALAEAALRDLGAPDPATAAVLLVTAIDGLELRLLTAGPDTPDLAWLGAAIRTLLLGLTAPRAA